MNDIATHPAGRWPARLEVIGATLFQRYRKRLMHPGIIWEIRRDYPGLSLLDIAVRVHAGRRIIVEGEDFIALEAIRSGAWDRDSRSEVAPSCRDARRDRLSRWLVRLGGVLVGAYCMVSLAAAHGDRAERAASGRLGDHAVAALAFRGQESAVRAVEQFR